jgi:hypothetical protein
MRTFVGLRLTLTLIGTGLSLLIAMRGMPEELLHELTAARLRHWLGRQPA